MLLGICKKKKKLPLGLEHARPLPGPIVYHDKTFLLSCGWGCALLGKKFVYASEKIRSRWLCRHVHILDVISDYIISAKVQHPQYDWNCSIFFYFNEIKKYRSKKVWKTERIYISTRCYKPKLKMAIFPEYTFTTFHNF